MAFNPDDVGRVSRAKTRKEVKRLCRKIFVAVDTDNSGYIERIEMHAMFRKLIPEEDIAISEAD